MERNRRRKCLVCGEEFTSYNNVGVVCSQVCKKDRINEQQRGRAEYKKLWNGQRRNRWITEDKNRMWAKYCLANIRFRCRKSGTPCDIDEAWMTSRLQGVCEVTGLPFHIQAYKENPGFDKHPNTPSVDKIDPLKGYLKENCRLVVWVYNRAKGKYDDSVILEMAKALLARHR